MDPNHPYWPMYIPWDPNKLEKRWRIEKWNRAKEQRRLKEEEQKAIEADMIQNPYLYNDVVASPFPSDYDPEEEDDDDTE